MKLYKGKLRTFYSFKSTFQRELYLDALSERDHQIALTKLRISAHRLEIENGRYCKKSIEDRLCKKCDQNQIEDEVHFICDCSYYNSERDAFFKNITDQVPNFASLNSFDKMVWLMTCENTNFIEEFAKFVHRCFYLRKTG